MTCCQWIQSAQGIRQCRKSATYMVVNSWEPKGACNQHARAYDRPMTKQEKADAR